MRLRVTNGFFHFDVIYLYTVKTFRRKSISGNWKANTGSSMLEQIGMNERFVVFLLLHVGPSTAGSRACICGQINYYIDGSPECIFRIIVTLNMDGYDKSELSHVHDILVT